MAGSRKRRRQLTRAELAAVLGVSSDGLTVQDTDGRLVFANAAAARLIGYETDDDLLRAPTAEIAARFEVMAGDGRPLAWDELPGRRVLRGSGPIEQLLRYRVRATGAERWALVSATAVRAQDGQVELVVNVFRDVTELAEHQRALEDSEARFRTLADNAPVMVWLLDSAGRCVWVNRVWTEFTGRTIAAELGDGWTESLHPDDAGSTRSTFQVAFDKRQSFRREHRVRRHDGEYRWVLDHGVPLIGATGEFSGFIGSCTDITYQVEQRRALEDASTQLEELATELEQTADELRARTDAAEWAEERARFLAEAGAVFTAAALDPAETLRSVARMAVPRIADWCTVHLLDEGGAVIQHEVAHSDPAKVDYVRQLEDRYPPVRSEDTGIWRAIRTGESQLHTEIPDELLATSARDEEHLRILRALGLRSAMIAPLITRDRTLGAISFVAAESGRRYTADDLQMAEELARRAATALDNARLFHEASEANRVKAQFMGIMSHELRTPLNAIIGYAELLHSELPGALNTKQKEHLDRIQASAWFLTQIIEGILAYARLEAGREEVVIRRVRARELLDEAVAVIEPLAARASTTVDVHLPDPDLIVNTDPQKLRQIVLNLMSNAVKFTERGTIQLAAEATPDDVRIRVRDTGPGIPASDLERIFEPFTQIDQSNTRQKGGTGLGLSVAASLARLLGGRIDVESETGKGSTFTVVLPLREVEPVA